ncbi:MAG: hypothetical protein JNK79_16755 [Chitinophagaceae bacterium]|nr:hypothetical protein [Chitinophagaceae bacterium]
MPGSLQNKLQQYEVTPPPAVWNKIAEQLDQEFVSGDSIISKKLDDASVNPPQAIWNMIDAELHNQPAAAEIKRITASSVIYKRIAAAAVLVGLVALGMFYFFSGDGIKNEQLVKINPDTSSEKPRVADEKVPSPAKDQGIASLPVKRKNAVRSQASFAAKRPVAATFSEPVNSLEQAPLYELNTVSALQPVSVSAPPLRDKSGNLILDLAMISNPDDPYITVTGPNGKQTKISSKFLNCLGYLNASVSSSEMDAKAIRCTTQFEEWRRRLLAEPAFIPTANNFFDIFELKDLLQEM